MFQKLIDINMNKYENEINKALRSYENNKPYHIHNIDWICNRIDWCWKWRKISESNKNDFVYRIIEIMQKWSW